MLEINHQPTTTNRGRIAVAAALALAILLAASPLLAGENLLENGEFPNEILPWSVTAGYGAGYWSNLDHAGSTLTGSFRIERPSGFVDPMAMSECVTIQGGAPADVSGYFKAGSPNPADAGLQIGRVFYSDGNCSTGISQSMSAKKASPASWTRISHAATAPANARSTRVLISLETDGSAMVLYADGLELAGSAALPALIFASSFESGMTGWVASN